MKNQNKLKVTTPTRNFSEMHKFVVSVWSTCSGHRNLDDFHVDAEIFAITHDTIRKDGQSGGERVGRRGGAIFTGKGGLQRHPRHMQPPAAENRRRPQRAESQAPDIRCLTFGPRKSSRVEHALMTPLMHALCFLFLFFCCFQVYMEVTDVREA